MRTNLSLLVVKIFLGYILQRRFARKENSINDDFIYRCVVAPGFDGRDSKWEFPIGRVNVAPVSVGLFGIVFMLLDQDFFGLDNPGEVFNRREICG